MKWQLDRNPLPDLRRRLWVGCQYTHTFKAAADDLQAKMPWLPPTEIAAMVRRHGDWDGVVRADDLDWQDIAQVRTYSFVWLRGPLGDVIFGGSSSND